MFLVLWNGSEFDVLLGRSGFLNLWIWFCYVMVKVGTMEKEMKYVSFMSSLQISWIECSQRDKDTIDYNIRYCTEICIIYIVSLWLSKNAFNILPVN